MLKNFDQSENGWKSYHGKPNRDYNVKEHEKLNQKLMSKKGHLFLGRHIEKTNSDYVQIYIRYSDT